jgi:hypothetical protein
MLTVATIAARLVGAACLATQLLTRQSFGCTRGTTLQPAKRRLSLPLLAGTLRNASFLRAFAPGAVKATLRAAPGDVGALSQAGCRPPRPDYLR